MTSEYMEKLNSILNDYKTKASALLEEYSKLTSIDSELGKEEISRIKEIKPELKDIKGVKADVCLETKRRTNYYHIHLHTSIEHAITPLIISVSNYASPLGVLNGAIVRSGSLGILILPNVCS